MHDLRDFRRGLSQSQAEVANILGITQQQLSKWENGEQVPMRRDHFESVAAYMGRSVEDVVLLAAGLDPQVAPPDLHAIVTNLRLTSEQLTQVLNGMGHVLDGFSQTLDNVIALVERQTSDDQILGDG